LNIKTKLLRSNAKLPQRQTDGSAGADLYANVDSKITILPNEIVKIPTGIAIELPSENYVGLVFGRSGLGIKHGISPANCVGIIDSDYRGEIIVGLQNKSNRIFYVEPNDRIAQLIIVPIIPAMYVEDELNNTNRGTQGFGSTGRQ